MASRRSRQRVLHRPDELDYRQDLFAVRREPARQRGAIVAGVDLGVRQADLAHVVAAVGAGSAQAGVVRPCGLGQRELAVARDHTGVAALESRLSVGRLRDEQQVRAAINRRGGPGGILAREADAGHEGGEDQREC